MKDEIENNIKMGDTLSRYKAIAQAKNMDVRTYIDFCIFRAPNNYISAPTTM